MKLTQKLLGFLNRVFDKNPAPFLAFRLRYNGAMTWTVADGVLTTSVTGGSGENLTVDLSQYLIGDLINFLAAQPGYTLPYGDQSELSLLSALTLLDASGDIGTSNGDQIFGYTSFLYSYLEANANELQQAADQIPNAIAQMSTTTAESEWLDLLGSYYNVPRLQGEPDSSYGPRIIAQVLRPRGNNVAMEAAIKVFTGQKATVTDVTLYGDVFPLYNGQITHDSSQHYSASRQPIYGLFDVSYGYDLINGGDITQFHQIVSGLVNRLRDAGTHLRSLLLAGSSLTDALTPPTDSSIPLLAESDFEDTLTTPDDSIFDTQGVLGAMADALTAPADNMALTIVYNYRYNGLRSYNSQIFHVGGKTVVESL